MMNQRRCQQPRPPSSSVAPFRAHSEDNRPHRSYCLRPRSVRPRPPPGISATTNNDHQHTEYFRIPGSAAGPSGRRTITSLVYHISPPNPIPPIPPPVTFHGERAPVPPWRHDQSSSCVCARRRACACARRRVAKRHPQSPSHQHHPPPPRNLRRGSSRPQHTAQLEFTPMLESFQISVVIKKTFYGTSKPLDLLGPCL